MFETEEQITDIDFFTQSSCKPIEQKENSFMNTLIHGDSLNVLSQT